MISCQCKQRKTNNKKLLIIIITIFPCMFSKGVNQNRDKVISQIGFQKKNRKNDDEMYYVKYE